MDLKERLSKLSPEKRALLLKRLSEEKSESSEIKSALPEIIPDKKNRYEPFPLNNLQQAYLVGRTNAFEMGNIPSAAYVELECKDLDLVIFESALQKLIKRHEILRSIVHPDYTQQLIKATPEFKIKQNDFSRSDNGTLNNSLKSVKDSMLQEVKDSRDWPLFDVQISKITDEINHVHFKLDLLNFDAGSIAILFNELKELYLNSDAELPELNLSYRDYLIAEKKFEETDLFENSKKYWMDRLLDFPPVPDLPLKKNPKDIEKPYFKRRISKIDVVGWSKLKEKSNNLGLTPTALLLTAFSEMLGMWSRSLKFSINIPLFNRIPLHIDVFKIMGDFTSVELLEIDRTEKISFLEKAKKIYSQLIADLDHRYFDGVAVLRELAKIDSDTWRKGVPVVFTSLLDHGFTKSLSNIGRIVDSVNQTAHVWLDLHVDEVDGELVVKFDAVEELFQSSLLDDMLNAYMDLLLQLSKSDEKWNDSNLDFFPAKQKQRRVEINKTEKTVPDKLLHTLFAEKVSQYPDSLAVVSSSKSLTFKELFIFSNRIGNKLRKLGAKPNELIAIIMEKGWEQIPAVYGILQSGSAYLPIDPDFPEERINHLLKDGEVKFILTQSWIKDKLTLDDHINCFCIDTNDFDDADSSPLEPAQTSNDLAYVLYTSGSTGNPKGVMIEHKSVVNRMLDVNERYGVKNAGRAIALTALQHDLSVYDTFGMLIAGGCIVIPDNDEKLDPAHWAKIMLTEKVTFWNSVPAFLEMLVDYLENVEDKNIIPSSLRLVVLSGDWIPVNLPTRLRELISDVTIVASGGPTETTIWDIYNFVGDVDPNWKSIPYGKPLANAKYYIMKENLEECPDYVIGEMCIGGIGLARGFWKDQEKTKEKFITHPVTGERLYKSGDLGCFLPDGNIQIAGRKDFQVKVRGLRIELGEIESAISKHDEIKDVVVNAVGESQTNKRLVAYIVSSRKEEQQTEEKQEAVQSETLSEEEVRAGSQMSAMEKMEFKLKHLEIRHDDDDKEQKELAKPKLNSSLKSKYLSRQSYRNFEKEKEIPLNKFSEFLSSLAQLNVDELPFPKYRYPSAGSLYPVQVYLYVKPNKVEGLAGGTYYYHPKDHKLVLLEKDAKIKRNIHTVNNYNIFDESGFSVFLVAQMKAIAPLYGTKSIMKRTGKTFFKTMISGAQTLFRRMKQQGDSSDVSRDFCMLEAGHMGQLLMTAAQENQIGLCPVGGVDFDKVRTHLDLEDTHIYLHGMIGGAISPNQMKSFSLFDESGAGNTAQTQLPIEEELKNYLADKLPDYMIPSNIVRLAKLPLTPNGKVDRKQLPIPDESDASTGLKINIDELSPSVDKISSIVEGVLKSKGINPVANLFNLGATSIQIIMIANQFENKLGFRPRIDEIYANPTIAAIAEKYDSFAGRKAGKDSGTAGAAKEDKTLELLKKVKSLSKEDIQKKLKEEKENV